MSPIRALKNTAKSTDVVRAHCLAFMSRLADNKALAHWSEDSELMTTLFKDFFEVAEYVARLMPHGEADFRFFFALAFFPSILDVLSRPSKLPTMPHF